ncbi:MAG TPA: CHC2 zinc finger domain-containing protein [Candidatus Dojkabacteria bacterium]|nr:CHC2 zinc finger domain-containing protein [Candidatus Dojkabacteria bacterium]
MEFSEQQRLSIAKAKAMDMVDYLSRLGYKPSKIRNDDYWYLSPLRDEKTPSFKVNRKLNRWYDHGLGKGGNLIDFAILHQNCTIGEFLQKLNGDFSFHQPVFHQSEQLKTKKILNILQDYSIGSFALLRYLEQRRIPIDIADQFCREVRYELNNKIYYGIGFKNDSGGYEIRNPYFKADSSP